ncbi:pyridoxamine 5'-phosphate oxidase family protein [Paracoccus sp. S-4012]|uniref:MSMEG_1061 family FMN-dependent PPOX-type flavoprotein n=1 Tax=Paracoccus sp. S-4012 TaxID=2665648 RepID=UPI0012AFE26B|nr:MSMEG_1061 family FMN-dependent PPOX-type flavoprotein [Paracoccus sp. S-4012]MRX49188.1 pyridoxamine 5'-phosphate oxidase family protein [Paracoccus sp. S-4012]
MEFIDSEAKLESLYGEVSMAAITKVANHITPTYRRWIEQARFCVVSTVGPGGTDASPRGDDGPVARLLDERTFAIPDWIGNNRIDSLRNLMHDPRISVMFMVAGSGNVVRVNGLARVTADEAFRESFARHNKAGALLPRTVMIVQVGEIYMQCSRALMRSRIWGGQAAPEGLPTQGQMIAGQSETFDVKSYDEGWAIRGPANLW